MCFSVGLPGRSGPFTGSPAVGGRVSQQDTPAGPDRHASLAHAGEGTAGVHHTGAAGPTVSLLSGLVCADSAISSHCVCILLDTLLETLQRWEICVCS